MARRKKRPLFFVCSSLNEDNKLISMNMEASSKDEASSLYKKKTSFIPLAVNGPFYLKKIKTPKINRKEIIFSNITKKAIYKDFLVNAFMLDCPVDHAYLVYIKNVLNDETVKMKSTIIVPLEELTILKESL